MNYRTCVFGQQHRPHRSIESRQEMVENGMSIWAFLPRFRALCLRLCLGAIYWYLILSTRLNSTRLDLVEEKECFFFGSENVSFSFFECLRLNSSKNISSFLFKTEMGYPKCAVRRAWYGGTFGGPYFRSAKIYVFFGAIAEILAFEMHIRDVYALPWPCPTHVRYEDEE